MEYIVHMAVFASQSTLNSEVYFVPITYVCVRNGAVYFSIYLDVQCHVSSQPGSTQLSKRPLIFKTRIYFLRLPHILFTPSG